MTAYRAIAAAFIRSRLQYRASFLARVAAFTFADLTPIFLIGIVLSRFGTVGGWRWSELGLLFGLGHTAAALARSVTVGLDHFEEQIVSGSFDGLLVRPLSPLLQVIAGQVDLMHASQIVVGAAVLAISCGASGVPITAVTVGVMVVAVIGGALTLLALTLLVAALTFWQTRTGKLQDIVQSGSRAFTEYPLSIYPQGVRFVLTFILPLALCTWFPALWLLGKGGGLLPALSALPGGAILLGVGLAVWRAGVRRYQSTGS